MIESIFPTSILKTKFAETEELKQVVLPKLETIFKDTDNQTTMKNGTLSSFNYKADIFDWPEMESFNKFVQHQLDDYWRHLKYQKQLRPYVVQMWANKTPPGGWVESHLHGPLAFTGVLYLHATKDTGNIVFENPLESLLASQPVGDERGFNFDHELNIESGDFVLFPGWLKHKVQQNRSNETRWIIGINVGCKGFSWSGQWT